MRESVSAILIYEDEFFIIQRQNYLKAFPGFYSFPGGKIDKEDHDFAVDLECDGATRPQLVALRRELMEELEIDLVILKEKGIVSRISILGEAITPDFNPHRFKNTYFKIYLNEKLDLKACEEEAQSSEWINSHQAFKQYRDGLMLVVPPMITILEDLDRDIDSDKIIDPNLKYNPVTEVPLIEPVYGLKQFLPLSNTFPPANRTNSFLIGDEDSLSVLIDPSPKCEEELRKFYEKLEGFRVDKIMLTHHHPDHHQFSCEMAKKFGVSMLMSADTQARIMNKHGVDYFDGVKVELLKEGDILTKSSGHQVLVLETPGHDEGQLTLMRADKAWAIVSDLIQTVGTVVIGGDEGDMAKYFSSLNRMIDLNPLNIFPSHGIGLGGVHKLKKTLEHRQIREKQVQGFLDRGLSREQMLKEIYPDLPERLHKYALLTIDAHIKKLSH